jgi:predicted ATP-grasp superfamily ATP-dependent carboligase
VVAFANHIYNNQVQNRYLENEARAYDRRARQQEALEKAKADEKQRPGDAARRDRGSK